jgi:hypothetical protein
MNQLKRNEIVQKQREAKMPPAASKGNIMRARWLAYCTPQSVTALSTQQLAHLVAIESNAASLDTMETRDIKSRESSSTCFLSRPVAAIAFIARFGGVARGHQNRPIAAAVIVQEQRAAMLR